MTDKEVIKALECCVDWCGNVSCWDCPLKNTGCIHFDKLKETLDLINRQKAEIERLKKGWKADVILTANVKTEAIKEFAERVEPLKKFRSCMGNSVYELSVTMREIDDILKEMVGDNNA